MVINSACAVRAEQCHADRRHRFSAIPVHDNIFKLVFSVFARRKRKKRSTVEVCGVSEFTISAQLHHAIDAH